MKPAASITDRRAALAERIRRLPPRSRRRIELEAIARELTSQELANARPPEPGPDPEDEGEELKWFQR